MTGSSHRSGDKTVRRQKQFKLVLGLLVLIVVLNIVLIASLFILHDIDVRTGIAERKILTTGVLPQVISQIQAAISSEHDSPISSLIKGAMGSFSKMFTPHKMSKPKITFGSVQGLRNHRSITPDLADVVCEFNATALEVVAAILHYIEDN